MERKSLSNDFTATNPVRASMPGSEGDMRTPFHFSFCGFFAGRKRVWFETFDTAHLGTTIWMLRPLGMWVCKAAATRLYPKRVIGRNCHETGPPRRPATHAVALHFGADEYRF